MNEIRTLIVDDAEQARVLLRLMLSEYANDVKVVGEAEDAFEAWKKIGELKPDLVFLDIEMPGRSGIELAEQLQSLESIPHIVFTTAYDQYAIRAFRLAALDYLLKPINENHLADALARIRDRSNAIGVREKLAGAVANIQGKQRELVTIPVFNGYENVYLDSIIYIKADGSYSHVVQEQNKVLTVSKNLKYFESVLDGTSDFLRVHRSCIVNMKHIKRYDKSGRGIIVMDNDAEIDLARDRRDEFLQRFGVA